MSVFRNARKNCTTAPSPSLSCPDKRIDIEGKCALVVDGTSGVGFTFANELLKMKAAKVVITGLDEFKGAETTCELNERYGPARVNFYQADIANPLEFERIILACKNMKNGSVIVNHTSALGLDPNSDMIAHSAASTGFLVTSMAFSKNKFFEKSQIRMMTLCNELIASMSVGSTGPFIHDGQETHKDIQISIAKSAAYLVKYGPNNTLWLCQRNGILSMVELQKIDEFTVKYEPNIIISDQKL